jgi:hypothetical protein
MFPLPRSQPLLVLHATSEEGISSIALLFMKKLYFVLIGLIACCGCNRESKTNSKTAEQVFGISPGAPVHFVVPVGFHGDILVVTNIVSGLSLKPNSAGIITIEVPANGNITVTTWDAFLCEHEESASFTDGTPIPSPDLTQSEKLFPRDKLGFYALGKEMNPADPADLNGRLVWFIGTKEELEKRK